MSSQQTLQCYIGLKGGTGEAEITTIDCPGGTCGVIYLNSYKKVKKSLNRRELIYPPINALRYGSKLILPEC